jgi:hypothetical protein
VGTGLLTCGNSPAHLAPEARDGVVEAYDPAPAGPPKTRLVEVRPAEPTNGSDLRRADDPSAGAVYDAKAAFWAVMDNGAAYGNW